MHPELLRALGRARHEDLLSTSRSRGQPRIRLNQHVSVFSRSRRRLGSLLIRTGSHLIGDRRAALELARE